MINWWIMVYGWRWIFFRLKIEIEKFHCHTAMRDCRMVPCCEQWPLTLEMLLHSWFISCCLHSLRWAQFFGCFRSLAVSSRLVIVMMVDIDSCCWTLRCHDKSIPSMLHRLPFLDSAAGCCLEPGIRRGCRIRPSEGTVTCSNSSISALPGAEVLYLGFVNGWFNHECGCHGIYMG